MPDQPTQKDRKLAEWFSKRKEGHLANFPGLENVTSAEAFKAFQESRRQKGLRVPTEIVWKDVQEANTYLETPSTTASLLEPHQEGHKEKSEKHDQHGFLPQRQPAAPAGIDEDPRYRAFLKQAHETWNKEHPHEAFNEETIITDDDGYTRVNPRLSAAVPTAHVTALGMFREKHGEEEVHRFEALEKKRVYKYHEEDPVIVSMRKRTKEIVARAFWSREEREKLGITGNGLLTPNRQEIVAAASLATAVELGETHPEKLRGYAERDPIFTTAHETLMSTDKEIVTKDFPAQGEKEWSRKRLIRQKIQQAVARILARKTPTESQQVSQPEEEYEYLSEKQHEAMQQADLQYIQQKLRQPPAQSTQSTVSYSQDGGGGGDYNNQGSGSGQQRQFRSRRPSRRQLQMGGKGLKQLGGFGNRAVMLVIQAQNAIPPHVKLAIFLILIILALILLLLMNDDNPPLEEQTIPVNITKSIDDKDKEILNPALPVLLDTTPVESDIVYAINVSYAGSATDIIVTDPIPEGSILVSTDPKAKQLDASGNPTDDIIAVKKVEWSVKEIQVGVGAPDSPRIFSPQTLTLTVRPNTNNDYIINQATAQAIGTTDGGGGGIPSGPLPHPNVPPNHDTCGGVYTLVGGQHNGDNFGDPTCELAGSPRITYNFTDPRDGKQYSWNGVPKFLVEQLEQLLPSHPDHVGYWVGIVNCEAPGFDPNNWTNNFKTFNPWGLFQMGASGSPGGDGWIDDPYKPGPGYASEYDRGDVNWRNQVYYAVKHNELRDNNWRYWGCARDFWGLWF